MSKKQNNTRPDESPQQSELERHSAFQLLSGSRSGLRPRTLASATRALSDAGFKNREIARALKARGIDVDEATIRRYIRVSRLPEKYLKAIDEGHSVNSVLAAAKQESEHSERHDPIPAAAQPAEPPRALVPPVVTRSTEPARPSIPAVTELAEAALPLTHAEWVANVHAQMQVQMQEFAYLNTLGAEAMRAQVLLQPQKEQTGSR